MVSDQQLVAVVVGGGVDGSAFRVAEAVVVMEFE